MSVLEKENDIGLLKNVGKISDDNNLYKTSFFYWSYKVLLVNVHSDCNSLRVSYPLFNIPTIALFFFFIHSQEVHYFHNLNLLVQFLILFIIEIFQLPDEATFHRWLSATKTILHLRASLYPSSFFVDDRFEFKLISKNNVRTFKQPCLIIHDLYRKYNSNNRYSRCYLQHLA